MKTEATKEEWYEILLELNKPKRAKAPSDKTNEKGKTN